MKMWGFVLAIFIFALLTSAINEAGLLNVHEVNDFNTDRIDASGAAITEVLSEDSEQSEANLIQSLPGGELLFVVAKMFSVLFNALSMTAYIRPTLLQYGMPDSLAMMFQTLITFIESIFIFQVWRRFRFEN